SQLTYVQNGLLASILLTTKAADFVVTGCGTGVGAMLALNSFPGVTCGFASEPTEAYLFSQINGGNALSIPFSKGFGWGAELNLTLIFERLFAEPMGGGYPKERAIPEQRNARILSDLKKITYRDLLAIVKDIDQDFLKETISGAHFQEYFFANAEPSELVTYLKSVLEQ
ncbi:TPA: RpiB/LacA/LacB family sugar-phosphate isomerase, partial [Streptococcus pyogenes]